MFFRTLCNRALINNPALHNMQLNAARSVSLKVIPTPTESTETFDQKNVRMNRNLSPHLTIYKPQLTSMLSITHRGTGMALTGYAAIFGLSALVCPEGANSVVNMIEGLQLGTVSLAALKFTIAFPFAYHSVNGVRHLIWDLGKFLTIKEVYSTGYAMLLVSTILTFVIMAL